MTNNFLILVKDLAIIVGIAILLPFAANQNIHLFIAEPKYPERMHEKYSKEIESLRSEIDHLKRIEVQLYTSSDKEAPKKIEEIQKKRKSAEVFLEDLQSKEKEENKLLDEDYRKKLGITTRYKFYIMSIVGLISLLLSIFIQPISISVGLILGGVFSLTFGYGIAWGEINYLLRFLIPLLGLLFIIISGFYHFRGYPETK